MLQIKAQPGNPNPAGHKRFNGFLLHFFPTVFWNIGAFASKGSRGQCLGWQCRSRPTASSGLKKPRHKTLPQHRIPATSRWGPARPQYCSVLSCTYIHMYVYMIYVYICIYIYSLYTYVFALIVLRLSEQVFMYILIHIYIHMYL